MLQTLVIHNFRSCQDVTLSDLGELTVLIGRNGAGKTNILKALEALSIAATGSQSIEEQLREPYEITAIFCLHGITYRYWIKADTSFRTTKDAAELEFALSERLEFEVTPGKWKEIVRRSQENAVYAGGEVEINATTPVLPALAALLPRKEISQTVVPVAGFLGAVRYYPLDEPSSVKGTDRRYMIRESEYLRWLARPKRELSSDSVLMRLIHMHKEFPEDFKELASLLGPDGLNLVKAIRIGQVTVPVISGESDENLLDDDDASTEEVVYFPSFYSPGPRRRRQFHPFSNLSFGTRRIIRILVSLFYDRSSLVLMEQPEDGIHPGLLHKLIPLLRSYADRSQLILASHSPAVFDRLSPEEVRLIAIARGITSARKLSKKEEEGARRYITEEGALSDFLEIIEEE